MAKCLVSRTFLKDLWIVFDPRFVVLLSQCLVGNRYSDLRQGYLSEDLFEDFDDGSLCALCLRPDRHSEALPVLPSTEEYSLQSNASKGKLPQSLQFVAPQRFVTSSLVQTLSHIDNMLQGTELEVHTNNGKTLPLVHRHPDAVVILWNKGDHDRIVCLTMSQLLPCLKVKDMKADSWFMIVFRNESKGPTVRRGLDVGLDFTDQPAPTPEVLPQPPGAGDDVDYPGYEDLRGEMPVDDEDMPPPQGQQPEPDLDDDPIELGAGGDPPSIPPGVRAQVPDLRRKAVYTDRDLVLGLRLTSSLCLRHLLLRSTAKSRMVRPSGPPVVLLPGVGRKERSPIQQTPIPEPAPEPPVPDAGGESDSNASVDYRDDLLLAVAVGDEDVLIRWPKNFAVLSFVPLDGDGFASWLTKQDKIKAGTVTPEMQRKYAKEIRAAKLAEIKSVDENGYFSKFKASWVCRGLQDKFAWDQLTDSPTAIRFWDVFHLDLKTALLQGGTLQFVISIGRRSVASGHRWWNRLDKFLRSVGLEPTRADRRTYVAYDGVEGYKGKSYLSTGATTSWLSQGNILFVMPRHCSVLYTSATKKMVDYAWRPVSDQKLLRFLGSVVCKKSGWFPYENGHALISHRAKALRSPASVYQVEDYPYRVSTMLRKGTWWIVERPHDLRQDSKPCNLEEEAEVLVLHEKASYKVETCLSSLPSLSISCLNTLLILCMEVPAKAERQLELCKKGKSYLSTGSFSQEKEPEPEPPGYLKELALHAVSCYAYDEESRSTSDHTEERSYLSCPDIAQSFNTETTKKMVD
ncbi:GIP [Symbiodinium sp. CCMP2456]|nr:GIP [Symbiodinium sp. CCMP2456]